jgi:IS30 family transposase
MGQKDVITEKLTRKELTEKDRYTLELCLKRGDRVPVISDLLGFHPKTIRREIHRGTLKLLDTNLREYECYKAEYAQRIHDASVSNRGRKRKKVSDSLMIHIRDKLRKKYSPDAIVGESKRDELFEDIICTKTLYNWLYNGYVSGFKMSRRKRVVRKRTIGFKNPYAKRISERPFEANERQSGHWEMDTVVSGKGGTACLLVLTERHSRTEMMYLLNSRSQACVLEVFDRLERRYKSNFSIMFKTITSDNGSEFLDSASLEHSCLHDGKRTDIYYAHPNCSYERGSNENANRLIRKFIKKGEDIGKLPVAYIKRIEKWMNNYPRRIFAYKNANMLRNP